ncbi:muconolactone Delta-isomerase [Hirschia litorea]|uniref:Muconolactone Delta-isomerase n=1 Tax=Hirschia litorea TaxID=1199156 RepID=A0ABW2IJT2_9PROT
MLFKVEMKVNVPNDIDKELFAKQVDEEKMRAKELQEQGIWRHLWRVAGQYANVSIFDVDSPQTLHDLMMSLPLFPYMEVEVTALCHHPSSIHSDDR